MTTRLLSAGLLWALLASLARAGAPATHPSLAASPEASAVAAPASPAPPAALPAGTPAAASSPGTPLPVQDPVRAVALRAAYDRMVHDAQVLREALARCCERYQEAEAIPCGQGEAALEDALDRSKGLADGGHIEEALSALQGGTAAARRALEHCRHYGRAHPGSSGPDRRQSPAELAKLLATMLSELRECCENATPGHAGAACESALAQVERLRQRAVADEAAHRIDAARDAYREALNTARWGLARCRGASPPSAPRPSPSATP